MALDICKHNWALQNRKGSNAVPSWDELIPFLPEKWSNAPPVCPDGGTYVLGKVNELPRCSLGGPEHSFR